jgi:hypothetical protein
MFVVWFIDVSRNCPSWISPSPLLRVNPMTEGYKCIFTIFTMDPEICLPEIERGNRHLETLRFPHLCAVASWRF